MNFKNLSIILAILSTKVLANPINNSVVSNEEIINVDTLVSTDESVIYSVEESYLEDAEDSYSEKEIESPVVNKPEIPVNPVLPCNDFNSCASLLLDNKELLAGLGISEEVIQYIVSQYDEKIIEGIKQKFEAINYGTKVDVNGHQMSVNIMGEQNKKTIVLLPALGIDSPILFYKDFVKTLSSDFKVITVEPFGYGISDVVEEERTNENVVSELHTCLQKLGVDKFYLMGHSIGGIYSIAYANKYPEEVLGFIGLDNTPANFDNYTPNILPDMALPLINIIYQYHIVSLLPDMYKDHFLNLEVEQQYQKYSEEDLATLRTIFDYRYPNPNNINESNLSGVNVASTKGLYFQCPTLMFVTTETQEYIKEWKSLHEAMITQPEKSEIIELESTHTYIHAQHKDSISNKIKKWIN